MIPNFYFQAQIPYTQRSLEQVAFNQMVYPYFYHENYLNPFNLIQNFYCYDEGMEKPKESPLNLFEVDEKKKTSQSSQSKNEENSLEEKSKYTKNVQIETRQKYGRNITSNIFRCLLKRISGQNQFKKIAVRLIDQKSFIITYEKFLQQIDKLSLNLKSYVKKYEMRRFIIPDSTSREQQEFCLLFRILARIYLKQQHTISVFHSKKINKESRGLHFILARQMQSFLK